MAARSAARPALEWDWDLEPVLDHNHFLLDGMTPSFQGKWNSRAGLQVTRKVAFKDLQMKK